MIIAFLRLDVMTYLCKHIAKNKTIMKRSKRCFSLGDDVQLQVLCEKDSAKAISCYSSESADLCPLINKLISKSSYLLSSNGCSLQLAVKTTSTWSRASRSAHCAMYILMSRLNSLSCTD